MAARSGKRGHQAAGRRPIRLRAQPVDPRGDRDTGLRGCVRAGLRISRWLAPGRFAVRNFHLGTPAAGSAGPEQNESSESAPEPSRHHGRRFERLPQLMLLSTRRDQPLTGCAPGRPAVCAADGDSLRSVGVVSDPAVRAARSHVQPRLGVKPAGPGSGTTEFAASRRERPR